MSSERPDPDRLLERVQAAEASSQRGRLRIFFGYAAGVGKTYAMLQAARREAERGVDVVVGYVEPHGRAETEALLADLPALPFLSLTYRGVTLREFDVDAALSRHPGLLLVDELAHTNAEGMRHAKRWQDVEELLDAGIDVWTTLNVQHVESLNDVIAQITGVIVRETLPDALLERADEVELIDLSPHELVERLQAGKVYLPLQAQRALTHFFQHGNLAALRELALRQVAQCVNRDVEAARQETAATKTWATNERLLVCVGPSPNSAKLIRTAKRMAAAFGGEWLVAAVETHSVSATARHQVAAHLRLAERLGAQVHTLVGERVAETLIDFARSRNVTKLIIGKTDEPRWRRLLFGTVVDTILDRSGNIDVYVIRGDDGPPPPPTPTAAQPWSWNPYGWTAAVVAACACAGWVGHHQGLSETNIVMLFILGVIFLAARHGRGPAIAGAVASVLLFDFLFVDPVLRFTVTDTQYLLTFAVMLVVGIVISALTARLTDQLQRSRQLEDRTRSLFHITRQLSEVSGQDFLITIAARQLRDLFDGEIVVYLRTAAGEVELRQGADTSIAAVPVNSVVARWVSEHEQLAGLGTDTLPNATALFAPLIGSQRTWGALGVRPHDLERFADPEQRRLLETCVGMIALSLERDQSVLDAHEAHLQVESEQLRNSLLSSVSHDLRTPLAAIAGLSAGLLDDSQPVSAGERRASLQSILDEASRLTRLVENLLDMTRLSAGRVRLDRQWHILEELIGSVRGRLAKELSQHAVRVDLPDDLPLVNLDGVLFEQVFYNLLENAARYTPPGSQITIGARTRPNQTEITVADSGPGLPRGAESQVFEKFFRATSSLPDGRRGVGLGLAICQAIVQAHGGQISAHNRPDGGAEFQIVLPYTGPPPAVPTEPQAK